MKEIICIVCPNSCVLKVEEQNNQLIVTGNKCKRGVEYAIDEIRTPKRVLTTTVATIYKNHPRLSVKTLNPIPKELILPAMTVINQILIDKPIKRGDVIIENICNCGVNVIATSDLLP